MTVTPQNRLWKLDSYRALDDKRRRLVSAILLEGLSFAAGCRLLAMNQTREAANLDLQRCLTDFRSAIPEPIAPKADKRKGLDFEDEEDEASWALHTAIDRMDPARAGGPGDKVPSDEAAYAAETIVEIPRTVELAGLDVQKIARCEALMRAELRRYSDQVSQREARKAEVANRTHCDGCQKTLPPDVGTIVGDFKVCGHCNHVWRHTGIKPTGPTDPSLTRVEQSWGLNVVTVPDYVAPLAEVPRG